MFISAQQFSMLSGMPFKRVMTLIHVGKIVCAHFDRVTWRWYIPFPVKMSPRRVW